MIGVVLCTHHTLAEALLDTTRMIVGEFAQAQAVCVMSGEAMDEVLDRLRAAIAAVDTGDGVVLLCDMFGGTPSNLSLSFLTDVEVVTGVNLPMLLKLYTSRDGDVRAVAANIRDHARDNILVAGELLRGKA